MMKKPEMKILDKTIDEAKQGEVFQGKVKPKGDGVSGKFYIESYGCAMNFNDSEIVASVLNEANYEVTTNLAEADIIFVNTCSIREKAEATIRRRLTEFNKVKMAKKGVVIGVLGCMAERLKDKFLTEDFPVDLVAGPDAYRDIPQLVGAAIGGDRSINVQLSREETYADINPLRLDSNGVTAFISIMRGCDNMCAFCVVPYTRGRERSRDAFSIVAEAADLFEKGYREVTLLGQNVDSYKWRNPETGDTVSFARLMEMVASIHPDLRIRFSTSHPKDITDEVLHTMAKYDNICKYIHLPVQSGSTRILKMMNRTYTRDWYMERIEAIRRIIPDCAISSDVITGFCSETEEDHQETLRIMEFANYSASYMFAYSERPNTYADRHFEDDVPVETKKRRLQEVIRLQNQLSFKHNQADIGKVFKVLIEGDSKKSDKEFKGRNSQNKMIVFPKKDGLKAGDYVMVKIQDATSATLKGEIISE